MAFYYLEKEVNKQMTDIDKENMHEIFCDIKNNRNEGLDRLFKTYHKHLYGISYSILKNKEDADEVLQILFMKLMNMDNELLPSSSEWTWIYSVIKNTCINYIRNNKESFNIDEMYDIKSESDEFEKVLDREKYNEMISCLSNDEKEIVSLKVLSDFSFAEIASMLNMAEGTVKWKYYKALNTVKLMLGSASMLVISGLLYFKMHPRFEGIDNGVVFPERSERIGAMLLNAFLIIIAVVFGILTIYFTHEFIKQKRRNKSSKLSWIMGIALTISIIINIVLGINVYKLNQMKEEMLDIQSRFDHLNQMVVDLELENEALKNNQSDSSQSSIVYVEPDITENIEN